VPFPRRKKFCGTQKIRKFEIGIPSIPRNENARNSVPSQSAEDKKNSEFRSEPFREDKELGIPFRTIFQNRKTLGTS
jgi:hypothetical protein